MIVEFQKFYESVSEVDYREITEDRDPVIVRVKKGSPAYGWIKEGRLAELLRLAFKEKKGGMPIILVNGGPLDD